MPLLFIWVPVISIITTVIRRLAKMKGSSTILRTSLWSLWLLGLVCVIGLAVSFSNNFRYGSTPNEQTIYLPNAKTDKLEVRASRLGAYYHRYNWLHFEPFADVDEDTAYINNLRVRVVKAEGDSFYVKLLKMSDGPTREEANQLSNAIEYTATQQDSTLTLTKGIAINREQKFRNQHVYVTIAVPEGKRIRITGSVTDWNGGLHFGFHDDDYWRSYDHWNGDEREYDWDQDVEYVMTKDGLKRADGKVENEDGNDDDDNNKIEDYNRSREELMQERDKKREEMEKNQNDLRKYDSLLKVPPPDTVPTPQTPPVKTASIIPRPVSISDILLSKLAI